MRATLAIAAASLIAGCVSTQPRLSDEERIRILTVEYTEAWEAGHSGLIMTMLTDDAVLMPHHGDDPIEGRDAISEFWFPGGQSRFVIDHFQLDPREISVDNNTAYARGLFQLKFSYEHNGKVISSSNRGNFLMILKRELGLWKIARYIWNDPLPETEARETDA